MHKNLMVGLIAVSCLVTALIIYLIVRHERTNDGYQGAVGALRPSSPGEYDDIGGVPRGLGWV